ncbi:polysaccharide pyruvyl transferase family protein [Microbacterium thalassium]|uniref:Polysaccharide pyruvyl transferase domain-containing protein n=1 Tax=Microbacterium thalassium TaxID=362649 RepID=A0A7X0KUM0_9MICO|nr:polysaccharide pyruvyl transferase family protein [Microbacterium thalassium]MBB6391307.1 hypothetical protein [Microbacterium thalassium]GLK23581.1 hypothetical protein GCM10017607_08990 [Microbacterium thalassium]
MALRLPARRRAPEPPPAYLVSTAGHPNYGDELIARAWLDHLAERHPDRDVWLDGPRPGRAAHLFAGTHPRVRFTDTLWELAHGSPSHDPREDAERIAGLVTGLGSPRFDPGLLALRGMASVHLLGGGYLNAMWHDNLGVVAALAVLRREFGIPVHMTGQGLMPAGEFGPWLREQVAGFDVVETRDAESAALIGGEVGLDDAFLALDVGRPVFDERPSPDRMVLVQGDLRAWEDEAAVASIASFLAAAPEASRGFVEAVPPDDIRYARMVDPDARFWPFGHIWADGLPARAGQSWLTSRFHIHLMAAAAGAAGVVISGRAGYYDIKHRSLLDLGTGWTMVPAGADLRDPAVATRDEGFPDRARELARRKRALADAIYPR